jgi:hypothetical protein
MNDPKPPYFLYVERMCFCNLPKHQNIYESYKRNHKGDNFQDNEKRKIAREKNTVQKMIRNSSSMIKQMDISDEDQQLEYENMMTELKKANNNSKTHKNRLNELEKNKDFK